MRAKSKKQSKKPLGKTEFQKNSGRNISKSNNNSRSSKTHSSNSRSQIPDNELWICGKHPIFSILEQKRRKIFEISATKNSFSELEDFLNKHSLSHLTQLIKLVENEDIENIFGKNQPHQGIAIKCSRLAVKTQNDLLEELNSIGEDGELPKLLLLDQVSDPHNIGAIIRSAISFGIKKIVFCEHNSPRESATIVKAAAGTIEFADLIVVTNFNNLIEKLKKIGYWCIGLAGEGTASIQEIKEYKNIALIVGSEGDGIRNLVKKNCDVLVRIEIDKEVESLNASVATAIALYELTRK